MAHRILIVSVCVLLALSSDSLKAYQADETLPPLNVSKTKISFDPKTAEVGASGHYLGLMEARLTILERNNKKCLFEYYSLGCGGISATQHIEVPIAAGPVVFDFSKSEVGISSLPKTARVVYSRNHFSGVRALVAGTDDYIEYTLDSQQSEMVPQLGDKVKFRYQVFESEKFERHLATADFTQNMEFEMGSNKMWPWLAQAMENMSVGDERRVQVPVKIASDAIRWLREPEKSETIYATIRLVYLERAKK